MKPGFRTLQVKLNSVDPNVSPFAHGRVGYDEKREEKDLLDAEIKRISDLRTEYPNCTFFPEVYKGAPFLKKIRPILIELKQTENLSEIEKSRITDKQACRDRVIIITRADNEYKIHFETKEGGKVDEIVIGEDDELFQLITDTYKDYEEQNTEDIVCRNPELIDKIYKKIGRNDLPEDRECVTLFSPFAAHKSLANYLESLHKEGRGLSKLEKNHFRADFWLILWMHNEAGICLGDYNRDNFLVYEAHGTKYLSITDYGQLAEGDDKIRFALNTAPLSTDLYDGSEIGMRKTRVSRMLSSVTDPNTPCPSPKEFLRAHLQTLSLKERVKLLNRWETLGVPPKFKDFREFKIALAIEKMTSPLFIGLSASTLVAGGLLIAFKVISITSVAALSTLSSGGVLLLLAFAAIGLNYYLSHRKENIRDIPVKYSVSTNGFFSIPKRRPSLYPEPTDAPSTPCSIDDSFVKI